MDLDTIVKRINFLYNKSKTEGLNDEEKVEQKKLREIYIQNMRNNFKAQLETIKPIENKKSQFKN